jgi:hypothetical protein
MSGWICLHREIQKHWIWSFDEPEKTLAWMDLLLSASHSGGEFLVKGVVVKCEIGQVAMSQVTLQKRWNWSQNKVKRFLKLLEKHGMIVFSTNDLTTLITICNYRKFQDDERADERPNERADERGTNEARTSRRTTLNNDNKVNKVNNENNIDSCDAKTKKTRTVFIKPSHQEICDYKKEKGLPDEVENFFNYYESNGWMVGKYKMKNWRAAFTGWCSRSKQYNGGNNARNNYKQDNRPTAEDFRSFDF